MELAIYSANIFTGDPAKPWAEALLVRDGSIALVGGNEEIRAASTKAEEYDLPGRLVTPGMVEGHCHFITLGRTLRNVDLRNLTSIAACREKIKEALKSRRPGEWLIGHGWNHHIFEDGREPTKADLDDLAPDNPVMMVRLCVHSTWVNSKALELAGISSRTPDPAGAQIVRDPATGEPTGILKECLELVENVIPPASLEQRKRMALAAQDEAMRHGITAVQSHENLESWEALDALDREGKLKIRVHHTLPPDELEEAIRRGIKPGSGSPRLWFHQIKLFCDGSLGSGTALMHEPYCDEPDFRGCEYTAPETLKKHMIAAYRQGCDIATHAIGDKALTNALNAYAAARREVPGEYRDRIEHVQLYKTDDLKSFKEMGLVASVQPVHLASDWSVAARRWGPERTPNAYAYRTLLSNGIPLMFGADSPVEPINPNLSLHAAVTRQDRTGLPPGGWRPDQKLNLEECLKAFTAVPAWCARKEDVLGSLRQGAWADITVFEKNLFDLPPDRWLEVQAEMTIAGGQVAYRK